MKRGGQGNHGDEEEGGWAGKLRFTGPNRGAKEQGSCATRGSLAEEQKLGFRRGRLNTREGQSEGRRKEGNEHAQASSENCL